MVKIYFAALSKMDGKDFISEKIIYEIAPVLSGVKPSSIMKRFDS